jgi:hypothetical protein
MVYELVCAASVYLLNYVWPLPVVFCLIQVAFIRGLLQACCIVAVVTQSSGVPYFAIQTYNFILAATPELIKALGLRLGYVSQTFYLFSQSI